MLKFWGVNTPFRKSDKQTHFSKDNLLYAIVPSMCKIWKKFDHMERRHKNFYFAVKCQFLKKKNLVSNNLWVDAHL